MIKAANTLLCLVFLLATAGTSPAQAVATDDAVQEAVRRQADTILLRQRLVEAQSAQASYDLATATKLYEACLILIQRIGAGVEVENDQVVSGLTVIRLDLAQRARKRSDYQEADRQINGVLRVDPLNEEALAFKKENDKALAAQAGKVPSREVLDSIPGIQTNKIYAATLMQDGRVLFELGRLDESEIKLKQSLRVDPGNKGADYYLNLIREIRYTKLAREREKTSKDKLVEVEQAWDKPVQRDQLQVPNPYARGNLVHTSKGVQSIRAKLDQIRLDEVLYDGLPLGEVIKTLSLEAKKRDPDKRGVNFMINPHVDSQLLTPSGFPGAGAPIDPTTGLPSTTATFAPAEPVELNSIAIRLVPALNDVRLADVLDAIVKVAERPIKYSVEDYAVVFSAKSPEAAALYTRFFKVDPNTFYQGLEAVGAISFGAITTSSGGGGGGQGGGGGGGGGQGGGQGGQGTGGTLIPRVIVAGGGQGGQGGGQGGGGGGTVPGSALGGGTGAAGAGAGAGAGGAAGGGGLNFVTRQSPVDIVQATVRAFFSAAGIDFGPTSGGKTLFFNDRQGMLMVRATLQDLDIVESAVQTLNIAPPQVTIQAKFVEITQTDSRALGFDWFLGNLTMANGRIVGTGGTQPSLNGSDPLGNPSTIFPNPPFGQSATDQLITSGLRNSAPTVATFTGILTDPQFRVAIRALEQRQGVDLLNDSKVTTLSGRQTHIEVSDIRTIITGNQASQTAGSGGGGIIGGGTGSAPGSILQPTTEALPFGPSLDVIPYVSADGYSVQMTLIPTLTEFLGYESTAGFSVQAQSGSANPLTAAVPQPRFRSRQVVTSVNVWDGQTIVVGGLITEDVTKTKDKVPVLGDLPLVGRLFRSESSLTAKKNLVIFVTPTIIDPAGNRYHSEEEMPFAQTSFPVQPTADIEK